MYANFYQGERSENGEVYVFFKGGLCLLGDKGSMFQLFLIPQLDFFPFILVAKILLMSIKRLGTWALVAVFLLFVMFAINVLFCNPVS